MPIIHNIYWLILALDISLNQVIMREDSFNNQPSMTEKTKIVAKPSNLPVAMTNEEYRRRTAHKPPASGKSSRGDSADRWPLRPSEQRLKKDGDSW